MNHIYYFGDIHKAKFLEPERVKALEAVRWAEDQGMTFTIHSDCPVTNISPLHSISIAVERKIRNGNLLGEVQKLTRAEAYRKMTLDAVILNGTKDKVESVETGKYADFVILNKNTYDDETVLSDDLVQMTVVDDRIVYKK